MRAWQAARRSRRGLSLLEMMAATAIMATLMGSVVVLVRSGYAVWNAYEADMDIAENAYGVLRHVVRQLRQAEAVTAISGPTDNSGDLTFTAAGGTSKTWSHSGDEVWFDNGTSNQLLAKSIDQLNFVGYEADGTTTTTVVNDIHVVRCTVQVTLPHGAGETRTVSCRAWIRSW